MSTESANKVQAGDVRHRDVAFNATIFMESRSAELSIRSHIYNNTRRGNNYICTQYKRQNESKIITFSKFEYKETFEIRKGNGQSR